MSPSGPDRVILAVAVSSPLKRAFDYLPDRETPDDGWVPGVRVRVPFGQRSVIGVVIDIRDHSDVPPDRLRRIEALIDRSPLPGDWLWLCRFAARYYQHSLGDTLIGAMPSLLRQGRPLEARTRTRWSITDQGRSPGETVTRAPRQAELLAAIAQHPRGLVASAITALGFNRAQLNALRDKGLIDCREESVAAPLNERHATTLAEPTLPLHREQSGVLAELHQDLDRFQVSLLHGVTGSGKTEVYLQLIEAVLDRGRQALVLVPEIGLTPQTLSRFRKRFNAPVIALHSGLNDSERLDSWEAARSGRAAVLIGTRSAVFTPLARPGVIIVDEEHDGSFKQQDSLRYHARDLAIARAQRHGIPIVLGSATPSLESLARARDGHYRHLRLNTRAGNAAPATLSLVDLRGKPQRGGLGPQALAAIREHLEAQRQVLVFVNRRGFAPTLACHQCGWLAECPQCDARMTLHRDPHRLICHHCEQQRGVPDACPECGSADLRPQGAGTERTEEALQEAFSDTRILRIDRDSTRRRDALEQHLNEIRQGEPCLLVGTQMLAKGHHFPHVTLVVVVNADGGLYSADFRALEHSAQLLTQVAGRAGRAQHPGRVLIQTLHPEDPSLRLLVEEGYDALAESLLTERRLAGLPPFRYMALMRGESARMEAVIDLFTRAGETMRTWLAERGLAVHCLGPVPAPMERRQNRYHAQLLLSADRRSALHEAGAWLDDWMSQQSDARRLRYSIDIDPQEMY
ncbi:replication restart DNA helicase PriA [Kushneria avicenniae]|uniref:Replication restart protein PriA n=1 Tax=Kushneria avicenniae TaxID=402385 RepID=A0A1I1I844_9GAMM|nr:primosomal protein N' [Kushneria avicenniae]SFC29390.1 replication restart DNA helicase PriA [Kushneria avicenniae]